MDPYFQIVQSNSVLTNSRLRTKKFKWLVQVINLTPFLAYNKQILVIMNSFFLSIGSMVKKAFKTYFSTRFFENKLIITFLFK
jgi:hypothetical protein